MDWSLNFINRNTIHILNDYIFIFILSDCLVHVRYNSWLLIKVSKNYVSSWLLITWRVCLGCVMQSSILYFSYCLDLISGINDSSIESMSYCDLLGSWINVLITSTVSIVIYPYLDLKLGCYSNWLCIPLVQSWHVMWCMPCFVLIWEHLLYPNAFLAILRVWYHIQSVKFPFFYRMYCWR